MIRKIVNTWIVFLAAVTVGYSQISPGDLSKAHADLEGMSNCTKCHELGAKVMNRKCLDCHDDIQNLINTNQGYHADASVVKKDCFECHSDHHGRKFEMIRFDEDNFNHDLAGYELEGEHAVVDCKKCHTSENIKNKDISKRADTFLGLEQECLACHDDFHQKTLSEDCISCHNMDAFTPVENFDHDKTDYKLTGKHIEVDCVKCHEKTIKNGKEYQAFGELAFNDCKSCHDDVHNNQIKGKCSQCHTENTFNVFKGQNKFNHNSTNFKLKGSHTQLDCYTCHTETDKPLLVFQDRMNINEDNCVACHTDQHEGKYGDNCVECHNEQSFLALNNMDFFDHTITDYTLEGKHLEVDCKQCHTESYSKAIDFSECKNCHEDYHREEFVANGTAPDCVECHSLNEGFSYSLYTLEQHQESDFELKGAHVATPCFACHISEDDDRWKFKNIGTTCIDCHNNEHEGYISDNYYPNKDCTVCHQNDSWSDVSFDHSITNWALNGKHLEINCKECHFEGDESNNISNLQFTGLESDCVSCHENKHGDSFEIGGVTDCNRCHVTDTWLPEKFNHNNTKFPLLGKHANLECSTCHTSSIVNNEEVILYKLNKFECIDCHQ